MLVTVHLHTILQRQTSEGLVDRLDLALPVGSTVGDLLRELAIELPLDALLLLVNGRVAEVGQVLEDGDQVNLMPVLAGG